MPKKTIERLKVPGRWLQAYWHQLLQSGMKERELTVLRLRDVENLTLKQCGDRLGVTAPRVLAIYLHSRRLLRHPIRSHIVPWRLAAAPMTRQ